MLFLISLVILFAALCVYFFFRAEGFQRQIIVLKREKKQSEKELQSLHEINALVFAHNEESARKRLGYIKNNNINNKALEDELDKLAPLIAHYAVIANECNKGKNKLHHTIKNCFGTADATGYSNFTTYIKMQDKQVQRMWSSNNLKGFINLVDAMLAYYERKGLSSINEGVNKKVS